MTIDMRPKVSEQYREDLMKELDNCCRISRQYTDMLSSLLLQFEARKKALEDGIQFSSEVEQFNYLTDTITIMEQAKKYASLSREYINKGEEIKSKLGL